MKFLMYYLDGIIKKFPLNNPVVTVGWSSENHLTIKDDFISKQHLRITVKGDYIIITDMGSRNGTYVNGKKVEEAVIKIGESFIIGVNELILKKGSLDEIETEEELIPVFNELKDDNKEIIKGRKTKDIKDFYNEVLKQILQNGLKKGTFNDFILDLSKFLSHLNNFGNFYIISKQERDINILLAVNKDPNKLEFIHQITRENERIFREKAKVPLHFQTKDNYYFVPLTLKDQKSAIIYIPRHSGGKEHEDIEQFLLVLSKEISLMSLILSDYPRAAETVDNPDELPEDIAAGSKAMKNLIKQAEKLAASDIFVLIEGEHGTGKELFAQLIHNKSKRKGKEFVALNCAAIPKDLQESELFGYEKGAFTGADSRKIGKLELASGGTLVLDEIGDMPLHLQQSLLRAIQEKKFYRLGGGKRKPIKVDLRIIALTNKNLKQLIAEKKFREDLYYRLFYRSIRIPPLRERKEDITELIYFFTNKFCKKHKKSIKGYSRKAFEALQKFQWPGNVRQLEHEIESIISLIDEDESITYDCLSDEIKAGGADFPGSISIKEKKKKKEIEMIMKALEKHDWVKARAAEELNMTYRGLQKKIKRLGIENDIIDPGGSKS